MVNTRHATFDPAHQGHQGNRDPLPNQPLPQNQPDGRPYQMPQPDDSQNFEDGADYVEGYYEEDDENEGGYHDHEAEDPAILEEEVDPGQEDPEVIKLRQ